MEALFFLVVKLNYSSLIFHLLIYSGLGSLTECIPLFYYRPNRVVTVVHWQKNILIGCNIIFCIATELLQIIDTVNCEFETYHCL